LSESLPFGSTYWNKLKSRNDTHDRGTVFKIKQRKIVELRAGTRRPVTSMEGGQHLAPHKNQHKTCVKLILSQGESKEIKE